MIAKCPDCAAVADEAGVLAHQAGCWQAAMLDRQSDDDRRWFDRFPNETVRRRKPSEHELQLFRWQHDLAVDATVRGAIVVTQLAPGVRHRRFELEVVSP